MNVNIELSDKEYKVLQEISELQGLPEQNVLVQGLRIYQLIVFNKFKLVDNNPLPRKGVDGD